jgi:RibD C-terminal domain
VAHGGTGFLRSLISQDLIDEYRLTLFPHPAGTGTRLFDEGACPVPVGPAALFGSDEREERVYRLLRLTWNRREPPGPTSQRDDNRPSGKRSSTINRHARKQSQSLSCTIAV